jgi:hypothetical protein
MLYGLPDIYSFTTSAGQHDISVMNFSILIRIILPHKGFIALQVF